MIFEPEKAVRKTDGLTIARMQEESWQNSEDHGFHEYPDVGLPTRLMLIVSELVEALEEHREGVKINQTTVTEAGKPEGIPSELADVIIRVGDLAGCYGIDLEAAVVQKMAYNKTRPHKHGKAY